MNLLDIMREEVTVPLRIVGLKGKKEVQLIDDACLKSLINIVREYYGYKDSDITMIGSAHESDIRADEQERCVQLAEGEKLGVNEYDESDDIAYDRAIDDVIKAIKAE